MAKQWYYGVGDSRQGPYSTGQLRALAEEGRVQPLDTIWREGVEQGVPAHQVKDLLPEIAAPSEGSGESAPTAPDGAVPPDAAEGSGDTEAAPPASAEAVEAAPPIPTPRPSQPPARKGRAMALKGAVITGQDGEVVFFS